MEHSYVGFMSIYSYSIFYDSFLPKLIFRIKIVYYFYGCEDFNGKKKKKT